MTRPADIPADLWEQADILMDALRHIEDDRELIARAIIVDRAGRLDTTGLTAPQAKALHTIATHQARTGVSPSYSELAATLGMGSRSGAFNLVRALAQRGAVILGGTNRSRTITINPALRSRA